MAAYKFCKGCGKALFVNSNAQKYHKECVPRRARHDIPKYLQNPDVAHARGHAQDLAIVLLNLCNNSPVSENDRNLVRRFAGELLK